MLTSHYSQSKRYFAVLLFAVARLSIAEEAVLSETFQLTIPQVRYQTQTTPEQWYWADLHYQPGPEGKILFALKNFGATTPNNTPVLLPLASISDQGAPQITDLTSSSATLRYNASTPLACAVVYGTDRQFGTVATDPAMNGSALTEHHPVMSGLTADTDYFYRLQGTAANGNLYWSEVARFHTPPAASTNARNVASLTNGARISTVSSNFGGVGNDKPWGANSAIDGSSATAWSSNGDGNNAFIEVTLAKASTIKTVEVWSRSMSDGSAIIRRFTLTVDSGQVFGPFTVASPDKAYRFSVAATTQTVRLNVVDSSGGNTGLVELGVY